MRRLPIWLVVAAALGCSAAPAAAQLPADPAAAVAAAVEQVPSDAAHVRFGARDTGGTPLDGLKVVQAQGRNVGVYHAQVGKSFELYVGTSADLLRWTRTARLDTDASQGTLAALPDGGFLVAYEWANLLDLLPRLGVQPQSLPSPLDTITPLQQTVVTIDRVRIRFRYYPTLARLLAGSHSRQFTAPRQLSASAQGTPSITDVALRPGLSNSVIDVGLHYRADTDGNGFPDDDRQGTAVLRNFSTWTSTVSTELNDAFAAVTDIHQPFTRAPRGSYGDRDPIVFDGAPLALYEAQYRRNDFASWRLFLRDGRSAALRAVRVLTPGASSAVGNPTITELRAPSGARALMVTMYVFGEGAAAGEAGPLIFYREL